MHKFRNRRAASPYSNSCILCEPIFGYSKDGTAPYKPDLKETIYELYDSISFLKNRTRLPIAVNFWFHIIGAFIFAVFLLNHITLGTVIFSALALVFVGTVYNTIWYHRFCSHHAFEMSHPVVVRLFLWTTPLVFRESTYAIPHLVHHQLADKPGDPYGPHLGWVGNYLAVDSSMKINTDISESQYMSIIRTITHIGFAANSYDEFKKSGSIEKLGYYFAKTIFAQTFWSSLILLTGGFNYLVAWYSAVFVTSALIRDFNWRGHGGDFRRMKKSGWEFDRRSYALNQRFYGLIASEWHDNHHRYPFSATCGFLPGQIDLAFQIIRLMQKFHLVKSYRDARPLFEQECVGLRINK